MEFDHQLAAAKCYANLIYYDAEQLKFYKNRKNRVEYLDLLKSRIESSINSFNEIQLAPYSNRYKSLDSLARGYSAIDMPQEALRVAKELHSTLSKIANERAGRTLTESEIESMLKQEELKNFRGAVAAIITEGKEFSI